MSPANLGAWRGINGRMNYRDLRAKIGRWGGVARVYLWGLRLVCNSVRCVDGTRRFECSSLNLDRECSTGPASRTEAAKLVR